MVLRIRVLRVLAVSGALALSSMALSFSLGWHMAESQKPSVIHSLPWTEGWDNWGQSPRFFVRKQIPHVTTYTKGGDRDQSITHRSFIPGPQSELSFTVHGGQCKVYLVKESKAASSLTSLEKLEAKIEAGELGLVIDSVAGPKTNDFDALVRWRLAPYAGQRLGIYVVDASTGSWGFISISELQFKDCQFSPN